MMKRAIYGRPSAAEVSLGCGGAAWCPPLSVAAVAASAGGVWVAMPPHLGAGGEGGAPLTALHVSVESAGDGQGLTLVHVRAQLEQLQDTFMS